MAQPIVEGVSDLISKIPTTPVCGTVITRPDTIRGEALGELILKVYPFGQEVVVPFLLPKDLMGALKSRTGRARGPLSEEGRAH